MMDELKVSSEISPDIEQMAVQRARDRAGSARWDLNIALVLFAVLIIIIVLLFQEIELGIVAPVAIFGLAMAWFMGWRRGNQLYRHFYSEEVSKLSTDEKRTARETMEEAIDETVQKALRERRL